MRGARTVLGIAVKSSAIGLGCLLWSLAGLAWAETSDTKVQDQPPKGFFVNLTLAQGYKESVDSYQTERFKPVNPGTTFKSDIEAVYMVFDLLPRENPANVIGQLFLAKSEGGADEKFMYEEAAYLTTAQESGFLVFPRPKGGWGPVLFPHPLADLGLNVSEVVPAPLLDDLRDGQSGLLDDLGIRGDERPFQTLGQDLGDAGLARTAVANQHDVHVYLTRPPRRAKTRLFPEVSFQHRTHDLDRSRLLGPELELPDGLL